MAELFFRCPDTGKEFDSGFRTEPSDLAKLPKGAGVTLRCRICGAMHEFKFAEARAMQPGTNHD